MNSIMSKSKIVYLLLSILLSVLLIFSSFPQSLAFGIDVKQSSDQSRDNHALEADLNSSINNTSKINNLEGSSAEEIVSKMSLKQKIEQMIMPCIRNWQTEEQTESQNFTVMNQEISDFLSSHNLAGLCLFGENIVNTEQTTRLCYDIQEAAASGNSLPYLLSVDQEGGGVMRLKSGTLYQNAMAITATCSTNNSYDVANEIAEEIKAVGFNLDFAPDCDVNTNPNNPIIGLRSFSDIPSLVVDFAKSFIEGIETQDIASTIKHYPGHGDTATDSHTGLPMVDKSREQLDQVELVPFRELISQGLVDCLMTAHIQYPQIEKET